MLGVWFRLHNIDFGLMEEVGIMARPRIELSKELLLEMFDKYHSWLVVADILGVTHPTIYRRLSEYKISKFYPLNAYYTCK